MAKTVPDPIREGLARGWKVYGGDRAAPPGRIECDIVVVGTGAGGGVSAELLAKAGLKVVLVEEGPLRSSTDFDQLEAEAYPALYQEGAVRKTADKSIAILQGRSVGGSTTVNWTTSLHTPASTLAAWRDRFGLKEYSAETLAPWFEQAERRFGIAPWAMAPNGNNGMLGAGCAKLGITAKVIPRNVRGCGNLGSCGMGCPLNAKQSMLVTTIPAALDHGAVLLTQTRAERLVFDGTKVREVACVPVGLDAAARGPQTLVAARHVVLAGGAINSPALLLRSKAPDPHARLGQRTFLHPTVLSTAVFAERIQGWQGAPQSVYSDHFLEVAPDRPIGFKLESAPMHPVLASSTFPGFGSGQAAALKAFPHIQNVIALMRDGLHDEASGGRVGLRDDGSGLLDYRLTPFVLEGMRRALATMAEIQFAAGAKTVTPVHEAAMPCRTWAEAKAAIDALPMLPYKTRVASAHVMGGCGMSGRPELGVCRPDGGHWQIENLSVHDGSLFPTSIGANPQLTIFAIVARMTATLATALGANAAALA